MGALHCPWPGIMDDSMFVGYETHVCCRREEED